VKLKDTHLIRLPHGADLLEVLTEQCEQRNIRLGYVSIIGSVKEATIGYYDQKTRIYQNKQVSGGLEITSCTGNISLKDGNIMVHAHILLSDAEGKTCGGHLMSPTTLFAGEALIQELEGNMLERDYDKVTGLFLWRNI